MSSFRPVRGAAGDLDAGFGTGGKVITAIGTGNDHAYSVLIQPDGKIVVVGTAESGTQNSVVAVVRYLPNGTLDEGFGTGGKVTTAFISPASGRPSNARSAALQSDGKIVVAGYVWTGQGYDYAMARYMSDGSLDSSFGREGKVRTAFWSKRFPGNEFDYGHSILVQRDGKILVGGKSTFWEDTEIEPQPSHFAIARYCADGNPDLSFGHGGRMLTSEALGDRGADRGYAMAVQSDGGIIVAGACGESSLFATVVRFHADGTWDREFGNQPEWGGLGKGKGVADIQPFYSQVAYAVAIQDDDKILISGNFRNFPPTQYPAVVRFNKKGEVDESFGMWGTAIAPVPVDFRSLKVQPDGRILAAGWSFNAGSGLDLTLARFTADGALDSSFGAGGLVKTVFSTGADGAEAVAMHQDGSIVAAGYAHNGSNEDFAVARYANALCPTATTLPATAVTPEAAILCAIVNANEAAGGETANVSFEWSSNGTNFSSVAGTPAMVTGSVPTEVSANLTGLTPGGTYYFRVKATSGAGITLGRTSQFTAKVPSAEAGLGGLTLTAGALSPSFSPDVTHYTARVSMSENWLRITPTALESGAQVKVNGVEVMSGQVSGPLEVPFGHTLMLIEVVAEDGETGKTYEVEVERSRPGVGVADVSYGTNGVARHDWTQGTEVARAVATRKNGLVLVASRESEGSVGRYTLSQYLPNGSPDLSFGQSGRVVVTQSSTLATVKVALQDDGKAVVSGSVHEGGKWNFATWRVTATGEIDSTFGEEGRVLTGIGSLGEVAALRVLPDGKILVAGYATMGNWDFALVRYLPDGSLDSGFGAGGVVTTDFGNYDQCRNVVELRDGSILAVGFSRPNFNYVFSHLVVARYLADGSLDIGFGDGGKALNSFGSGGNMGVSAAERDDGSFLIAAVIETATGSPSVVPRKMGVLCLRPNGELDMGFGVGGKAQFGTYDDICSGMVVQPDGRIVLTGHSHNGTNADVIALRLRSNGELDATFGADGKSVIPIGVDNDSVQDVTLLEDGRILLAGSMWSGVADDLLLLRLTNALAPTVKMVEAENIDGVTFRLKSVVNANEHAGGGSTEVWFEYSEDGVNYAAIAAAPEVVTGSGEEAVDVLFGGLELGKKYWVRVRAANPTGTTVGTAREFTALSNEAGLANLTLSSGVLAPAFSTANGAYQANVPYMQQSLTVTPTAKDANASVTVNGAAVVSGAASALLPLVVGDNDVSVVVRAADGTEQTYQIVVRRAPPIPGQPDLTLAGAGLARASRAGLCQSMAVQGDGKVVLAGYSGSTPAKYDFALARFLESGELDPSFGSGGMLTTDVQGGEDRAVAVAVLPDGKLLVAGDSRAGGDGRDLVLARYLATGTLDVSFGNDGMVITDLAQGDDTAAGLVVREDGRILIGATVNRETNGDFALVGFLPDGSLDASFGTGGKMVTAHLAKEACTDLALQEDGKIVLVGQSGDDFAVRRFHADGSTDKGFGSSGRVLVDFGRRDDAAESVIVQEDGKIVVVGSSFFAGNCQFAVVRLTKNGTLDASFGHGGKTVTSAGGKLELAHAAAVQHDGRIVVVGSSETVGETASHAFAIVALLPNGALDPAFASGGKLLQKTGEFMTELRDVVVLPDGRIVAGGHSKFDFVVLRHHGLKAEPVLAIQSPNGAAVTKGTAWSFPAAHTGLDKKVAFKLKNVGATPLTQIHALLQGANSPMFALVTPPALAIGPGQESILEVRYAPGMAGQHTAVLRITSNDEDASPFDIILKGNGAAATVVPVKTLPAMDVTFEEATLRGSIDPKGSQRTVWFEYGTTAHYGSEALIQPATVMGDGMTEVQATVTGLLPHTKYHYRLRSHGSLGEATAAGLTFVTANRAPTAQDDDFEALPGASVVLNVTANDGDADGDPLAVTAFKMPATNQGKVAKVNGKLLFTAAAGFTEALSFDYTVSDGFGKSASASVLVKPGTASISPAEVGVASAGETYEIAVTASGLWSVSESLPWVTVTPATGEGDGVVLVKILPHHGKAARKGKLIIAGKQHEVTQAGVSQPGITVPAEIFPGIVSGAYELAIPTVNKPVVYTVTGLPSGLAMNQADGVIRGKPTKAGNFAVKVTARNAAGAVPAAVEFNLLVAELPPAVVGTYHGFAGRDGSANANLGSRMEMTVSSTGAVSGKVISGVASLPFTGRLDAKVTDPAHPELQVGVVRRGLPPLIITLTLDAASETAAGFTGAAPLSMWRQVWKSGTRPATAYAGGYNMIVDVPEGDPLLPSAYGLAAFTVDAKTGVLRVSGTLGDASPFVTATFVGPLGQVLLYQPLYGNKGSFVGAITISSADRRLSGAANWYKPPAGPNSKDTHLPMGFGPAEFSILGGPEGP